jgi:hypothetical protein
VALNLIEYASVGSDTVVIKFARTVKISSLINANFIVQTTASTPSTVSDPFIAISTIADYNQISRVLVLNWNKMLSSSQEYYIRVNGLVDAANQVIPEEKIRFTKTDTATPISISEPVIPQIEQILVEDKSIIPNTYTTYQVIAKNPEFFIESIDPNNGDFYIDNTYNNGRVIITFNERPASNFLNKAYFKVQRKIIQRTPTRWETLEPRVSMHSWKPDVYVDFPSLDATPSYYTDGPDYFETGYKYRIVISENIGI